jgi:uncharacterized membrane protein
MLAHPSPLTMNLGITELVYVFGIIVLLVLVTAMIAGVGLRLSRRLPQSKPAESSLEILKARYARGEISSAQFEQMKRNLS